MFWSDVRMKEKYVISVTFYVAWLLIKSISKHIEPRCGWATATEEHIRFDLKTGKVHGSCWNQQHSLYNNSKKWCKWRKSCSGVQCPYVYSLLIVNHFVLIVKMFVQLTWFMLNWVKCIKQLKQAVRFPGLKQSILVSWIRKTLSHVMLRSIVRLYNVRKTMKGNKWILNKCINN